MFVAGSYLRHMTDELIFNQTASPAPHPRAKPISPVNMVRVVTWTTLLIGSVYSAMVLVADAHHSSPWSRIAILLLGIALVPIAASPIEWIVHRFVYHEPVVKKLSPIFSVHTAHHFSYFPTWRYVTNGPARRLPVSQSNRAVATTPFDNASIRLTHFAWYMTFGAVVIWLPGWFITRDWWFVSGLMAGSAIVSNLFIVVHDTIHRPGSHRFIEAQRWFDFLDTHHYIHHVELGVNLNFLLPLADLLFGTLRLHLTDDEVRTYGTLDAAKAAPIGEGGIAIR